MPSGHVRLVLSAFPTLADAQAEAANILSPHVGIAAVQLVNATRPVAWFVVPEGYACAACGHLVGELVSEDV
jgi:hypothetical protein